MVSGCAIFCYHSVAVILSERGTEEIMQQTACSAENYTAPRLRSNERAPSFWQQRSSASQAEGCTKMRGRAIYAGCGSGIRHFASAQTIGIILQQHTPYSNRIQGQTRLSTAEAPCIFLLMCGCHGRRFLITCSCIAVLVKRIRKRCTGSKKQDEKAHSQKYPHSIREAVAFKTAQIP